MGKLLPSTSKLQQFTKMATPNFKSQKPVSENRIFNPETSKSGSFSGAGGVNSGKLKLKMENTPLERKTAVPLGQVVHDCIKRWFADTLKEAKAGDISMQVLVAQMYSTGYGTPKDAQKGRAWIKRATKSRSSASKLGDKRPGYNASDSDSEELNDDAKEIS